MQCVGLLYGPCTSRWLSRLLACARGEAAVVLSQVGGSFGSPVPVTAPPGDTHRQFVLEENGVISVLVDGVRQSQPFLTVPHGVDEGQNVLSLAFAPDYATSGLFYVYEQRWDNTSTGVQNVEGRVQEFSVRPPIPIWPTPPASAPC